MTVRRAWRPWSEIQVAIVDEDRPDTANVMLNCGFTTIYEETRR